jgi:hypothetical protein
MAADIIDFFEYIEKRRQAGAKWEEVKRELKRLQGRQLNMAAKGLALSTGMDLSNLSNEMFSKWVESVRTLIRLWILNQPAIEVYLTWYMKENGLDGILSTEETVNVLSPFLNLHP